MKGLSGKIKKTTKVYTNDPINSVETLTITAFVKVHVNISPKQVNFYGYEGQVMTRHIKITANEERSLKLEPIYFDLTEKVTYQIEVIEPGKKFEIHFKNVPSPAGNFKGLFRLKTNYPEKPEISIQVTGKFRKKIVRKSNENSNKSDLHNPE